MSLQFSNPPSLVAYVTCGDPDLGTTKEIVLAAVEAGASVIELGVPFSDPLADGPVIQRASQRALAKGTTLEDVLEIARQVRQLSDVGLVVFSYLNPIMRMGVERFAANAKDAGIDGALVTDLPVEEAVGYLEQMKLRDLSTVFLAAPTSTDARLKRIANVSSGFVYAVSRTGVTGARKELPQDAKNLVQRLRKYTKSPIAVGFGISDHEQYAAVGKYADAAVVGSAIVQTIESNRGREAKAVREFIRGLLDGGMR